MTSKEFIRCLQSEVLTAHLREYFEVLDEGLTDDGGPDDFWLRVTELYAKLKPDDREVIRRIFRRVAIETISGFLAVIDGVTVLQRFRKGFQLTYDERQILNGELQDIFLELNEKEYQGRRDRSSRK